MALIQVRPAPGSDDGRPAIERWWYEAPTGQPGDLYCYLDRLSYLPGETAGLHVYCAAPHHSLTVERDGAERVVVHEQHGLPQAMPDTAADCFAHGCAWPATLELPVGRDWPSGGYVVTLRAEGARPAYGWFAVRPPRGAPDRLLLVCSTSTWTAYNDWGGCSHYEGIGGPSPQLSLERPWSRVTVHLPEGAPRKSHPHDVPLGWVPHYPTAEWGWAMGESKHAGAAGWAAYERHFARWAERQGYAVDVATQHDLHQRPDLLDGYRTLVLVGHDEYWSWQMRDAVDAFVDAGGAVVRLAGNFLWQVRLEQDGRVQVCHKYTARDTDPVAADPDRRHLLTSAWDDPLVGRQGAITMGTTATRGVYVRTFAGAPRASGGYTVYRPDHWLFDGADLYYGDQLGASSQVFAYEVDGLDYTFRRGLPYATGADGVDPDDVEILAMGPATLMEEDHGHGGPLFAADDDARFIALMLEGDDGPDAVERVRRGNGMLAVYRRGAGTVVNAGSVEWVNGLRLREPFVERITHTALRRFLG